jgi:hypothetical protein
MENVGIFYDNLEYFTSIWYIFEPFGNLMVIWYIFSRFGILCQEKSGNHETVSTIFLLLMANHEKGALNEVF